ncbi:MAG: regulatory signaling modulator protein AmpE [Gammaproteobacteria bacterium]
MKFLVILLCLTINYLWLKDLDRFDDTWFIHFRRKIAAFMESVDAAPPLSAIAPLVFIYGIPLLLVGVLLLLLQDIAFGLFTMALHMLVLLIAFDRTQPGNLVNCFLQHWRRGDTGACKDYLEQEICIPEESDVSSPEAMSEFFKEQLIYRCFEKMFVMFFWYMLTGPLGIVFCYVSYQLRDTQADDIVATESRWIDTAIYLLEWIPLRLLAITFSLAGNFVHSFDQLRSVFWEFNPEQASSIQLYSYASSALTDAPNAYSGSAGNGEEGEGETRDLSQEEQQILDQEREIENLQALLERSQAIWLAVLALITIFGLQSA